MKVEGLALPGVAAKVGGCVGAVAVVGGVVVPAGGLREAMIVFMSVAEMPGCCAASAVVIAACSPVMSSLINSWETEGSSSLPSLDLVAPLVVDISMENHDGDFR